MRWMEPASRGVEITREEAKYWLTGKRGFIFTILMLILAFVFHMLR
jgi:hypothetical protein